MIYWVPVNGGPWPISINAAHMENAAAPTDTEPGAGFSHFADCTEADKFRSRK